MIDKDSRPGWQPATLDAVDAEAVDGLFRRSAPTELELA